jgi:transcription initiation factor IIE alpha subunit
MATPQFVNYYHCPDDGTAWVMTWECMCDDRCPKCGNEIEPYKSEDFPEYGNGAENTASNPEVS